MMTTGHSHALSKLNVSDAATTGFNGSISIKPINYLANSLDSLTTLGQTVASRMDSTREKETTDQEGRYERSGQVVSNDEHRLELHRRSEPR